MVYAGQRHNGNYRRAHSGRTAPTGIACLVCESCLADAPRAICLAAFQRRLLSLIAEGGDNLARGQGVWMVGTKNPFLFGEVLLV